MKCQHCSREVKLWQTFCPFCGKRLQHNSFSTITVAPVTLEQQARRRLLRKTLQLGSLAVMIIVLASVIRLGPPQASPLPPVSAANKAPLPAPLPKPESTISSVPPVAPLVPVIMNKVATEARLRPIDLMADIFEVHRTGNAATPKARAVTVAAKKPQPILDVTDEALPKKVLNPIVSSAQTVPATNPAASGSVETEAHLELDASRTLLQPNTGLISIKSYVPARVYIDGVYSGVTPRSVKLLTGEHHISLMAGGYHDYTRMVKLGGQQQIGILASMSKK